MQGCQQACAPGQPRARREAVDMSDAGSDPINFREIDARGNPSRYGREHVGGGPGAGSYSPGRRQWGGAETDAASTPVGYMLMTFAPFLLFAGLLGIMGLLFGHAGQWRRNRESQWRRGPEEEPPPL